jgi:hypothetical protein
MKELESLSDGQHPEYLAGVERLTRKRDDELDYERLVYQVRLVQGFFLCPSAIVRAQNISCLLVTMRQMVWVKRKGLVSVSE